MEKDDRFKNSNFGDLFGSLQKTHYLRRGCGEKVFLPGMVFFCVILGLIAYIASGDWLTIPVCVLPFLLLFFALVRDLYKTRRDELRIYEHGFTFQSGNDLQTCLWTEMKRIKRREPPPGEILRLENGKTPLESVKKKSGELISFDYDMPGTSEILEKFDEYKPKPKLKR